MRFVAPSRSRNSSRVEPAAAADDLVLHHRDVRGRPAERGHAEAQEEQRELAEPARTVGRAVGHGPLLIIGAEGGNGNFRVTFATTTLDIHRRPRCASPVFCAPPRCSPPVSCPRGWAAQAGRGEITGEVRDPAGARVAEARVSARGVTTGRRTSPGRRPPGSTRCPASRPAPTARGGGGRLPPLRARGSLRRDGRAGAHRRDAGPGRPSRDDHRDRRRLACCRRSRAAWARSSATAAWCSSP